MKETVRESKVKACSHARTQYYIEGEGYCDTETKGTYPSKGMGCPGHGGEAPKPDPKTAFRFCRMFAKGAGQQSESALVKLGQAMVDAGNSDVGNSELPGGFTYLGQFIDHDISRDESQGFPVEASTPEQLENFRSPHLDLDSVYGDGPEKSGQLYEADGIHLKIGQTTGRMIGGETFPPMPNDLPRLNGQAIIGDHRNDENLVVAQTHLAFLKFHNKVADQVQGVNPAERFDNARKIVRQHYQSIVWHHFVPWIVDQGVYQDICANGREFYMPGGLKEGEKLCMPIEFSVAAYRFGHSLVRNVYEWNRIFNSSPGSLAQATLDFLFDFSHLSGNIGRPGGTPTVPTDWIIDWTRFFDFSDNSGVSNHPQSNQTRKIDTRLAIKLGNLEEFKDLPEEPLKSLAVRNLLRGRLVGLPTGQEVAADMGVTPLSTAQIVAGPHGAILQEGNLHTNTPLWYYILREAQVQHDGLRLGQIGSRIVAETFHGLIENSKHSILKEQAWKPSLHPQNPVFYTMSDMLTFVGDLNPLG